MEKHPHSPHWFRTNRPEIWNFVGILKDEIDDNKRHILVRAPVKSGKREIVECISISDIRYKVLYATSLNRIDVKAQQKEMSDYGIDVFITNDDKSCKEFVDSVILWKTNGRKVVICIDECDYGSGVSQKLANVFKPFVEDASVIKVYFSATSEETEASTLADRIDYTFIEFEPPEVYCGASYFLENDLIFQPEPFIERDSDSDIVITDHAKRVCRESITPDRHIGCIRIINKDISSALKTPIVQTRVAQQLEAYMPGKPWQIEVIDQNRPFEWEREEVCNGYCMTKTKNYLFVFQQTCTRGTDLKGWHSSIAFWHDIRSSKKTQLNTLVQAILRPSHYASCYLINNQPTPQPIRLYVDRNAIEMAAYGDMDAYVESGGKVPTRTRKTRTTYQYEIHETQNFDELEHKVRSIGQTPMSLDDFDTIDGRYCVKGVGFTNSTQLRAWSYEDAIRNSKAQFNRKHHYKYIPCYKDLNNPSTLVWIITRKLDSQKKSKPIETTQRSMFNV